MSNDSNKVKLPGLWIIRTGCPGYRIMKADLDPETKELQELVKDREALRTDYRTRDLKKPMRAAESLDHEPERETNMVFQVADDKGDFYITDGDLAREIFDITQKDPPPRATLDPRSPELPPAKSKAKAVVTAGTPAKSLDRPV